MILLSYSLILIFDVFLSLLITLEHTPQHSYDQKTRLGLHFVSH